MAKRYPEIGSMIAKRDKESGEPVTDKNGKATYYIKIGKDVKLTVNGKPVESGYLNINRPRDKFDRMLEAGKITKQEHAQKIAQYEKGGDYDYVNFVLSAAIEE